jgi:hypothetical protein
LVYAYLDPPNDMANAAQVHGPTYEVQPRSVVLLLARSDTAKT